MTPIKVAILDDHEFILSSLTLLAETHAHELRVVHAETDADSFLELVTEVPVDVAIVDLMMDGAVSGHHTISALSAIGVPAIAFTADHRRIPIRLAMQAGARGLVLKSDPPNHLREAIHDVMSGGWAQSSALADAVLGDSEHVPSLTPQELLCLRLASEGVPVKAIGRQFTPPISLSSVKTYMARAFEKYAAVGRRVSNTTQAAIETASDGWFDVDSANR